MVPDTAALVIAMSIRPFELSRSRKVKDLAKQLMA